MHETVIAQSILDLVRLRLGENPDARSVLSTRVRVGEFRNVDEESLLFAFDNLKSAYPGLERCVLQIDLIRGQAVCRNAGHAYHPVFELGFRCTECDGGIDRFIQGEELDIANITIETTSQ